MSYPSTSVEPNTLEQGLRSNHPDLKPFIRNCIIKFNYGNEHIHKLCNVPHQMIDKVRSEIKREREEQEKKK